MRASQTMFKFHRSTNIIGNDLLESRLFDEQSFYKAFLKDFKHAKKEVLIESPFMTVKRAEEITPLCRKLVRKGVKIKIFTRNPNHHEGRLRIQAWIAIKMFRDTGVKVRVCNDMRHRKLAVVDGAILWEGSLNMLSQNKSREMMRRTVSEVLSRQVVSFAGLNNGLWW